MLTLCSSLCVRLCLCTVLFLRYFYIRLTVSPLSTAMQTNDTHAKGNKTMMRECQLHPLHAMSSSSSAHVISLTLFLIIGCFFSSILQAAGSFLQSMARTNDNSVQIKAQIDSTYNSRASLVSWAKFKIILHIIIMIVHLVPLFCTFFIYFNCLCIVFSTLSTCTVVSSAFFVCCFVFIFFFFLQISHSLHQLV